MSSLSIDRTVKKAQTVESLTCKAWAAMAYDVGLLQVHVQCCVHAAGVDCGRPCYQARQKIF